MKTLQFENVQARLRAGKGIIDDVLARCKPRDASLDLCPCSNSHFANVAVFRGVDMGISVLLALVSVDIHTVVQHYLEKFISVFVLVLEGNTRQCCVIHRACIGISKGM